MIEDAVLIWKYKRGSRDALRRIYEKYRQDLLQTLAVNFLGDTNSAEDVVQDVFVSFVQSAEKFRLTGSLKGYLITCIANKSRDYIRKRQKQASSSDEKEEQSKPDTNSTIQLVEHSEELERLSLAMAQLPHPQREAIALHLHGGLKFRQIAGFQQVSIKTAQSRFRCELDKLRSIMNGEV